MKIEQKLLNCDDYGNVLDENGFETNMKVKRTLKASCLRRGVNFDEDATNYGLYKCYKTLELYKKYKEIKTTSFS